MTHDEPTGYMPMNRRAVLKSAAVMGAVGTFGLPAFSGSVAASHGDPETYTLKQGANEWTVSAVTYHDDNGDPVSIQDFYNYAVSPNLGGANTPLEIEENLKSRVFLYRDADGLYLVLLHDDFDSSGDTAGKDWQALFDFTGLPASGSWVVDEDNDPTEDSGTASQFYWRWHPRWSDGSAYGVLPCSLDGDGFEITMNPDFNPNPDGTLDAPQSEEWLDAWEFYNWDGSIITLNEEASLTISCAENCLECDLDGLLAKYEFACVEEVDDECVAYDFVFEKGDSSLVTYEPDSFESKVGEEYEPVSATFGTDYCTVYALVKAGQELEVQELVAESGEVTAAYVDPHAISYVAFYCTEEAAQAAAEAFPSKGKGRGR